MSAGPWDDPDYAYEPASDVDAVIEGCAQALHHIYENRTAGDFTFVGVLATFLMQVDAIRAGTKP